MKRKTRREDWNRNYRHRPHPGMWGAPQGTPSITLLTLPPSPPPSPPYPPSRGGTPYMPSPPYPPSIAPSPSYPPSPPSIVPSPQAVADVITHTAYHDSPFQPISSGLFQNFGTDELDRDAYEPRSVPRSGRAKGGKGLGAIRRSPSPEVEEEYEDPWQELDEDNNYDSG